MKMLKFDVWSRRATQALFGVALAAVLTACGGGGSGNAGTPVVGPGSGTGSPSGGTPTASAADLVLVLSKSTMTNSGTDSITATVTSVDANRAAVGGVPVSFSVNSGAIVTPDGTATDSKTGALTAKLTQGSDTTPRQITVTVTSGSITQAVKFNIVQNSTSTNPQANDLTLSLSASSINDNGSDTVVATATAVDANRIALSGIPVQLSVSDSSAFLISPSSQTNSSGQVTGTVGIGPDHTNRTITVTATSGTLVRTAAFQVTGAKFAQATALPATVTGGASAQVKYMLSDINGNAMVGVPISVSGSGITSSPSGAKTDSTGQYVFNYTAPINSGSTSLTLTINASAGGADSAVTVTIPAASGGSTAPVATTPASKTLNLSANVVSVNTAVTNNYVTVSAIFRDSSNKPIPNVRVLFASTGDNLTSAEITLGRGIGSGTIAVLSDSSGVASTTYAPGATASPTNGVTIQACWKTTDFAATDTVATCAAAGGQMLTTPLTVVSSPVSISIGTDNTISSGAAGLTYVKKYVVLVVDAAGNPKAGVQISPSVDLGGYGKGQYILGSSAWFRPSPVLVIGSSTYGITAVCPNEDLNRNGVIDSGEDVNSSNQLDPRSSDVAISLVGSTQTDQNGVAILQLEYPKSLGSWVKYKITVTAAGVLSPPAYYPRSPSVLLPSLSVDGLAAINETVDDYLVTYDWLPVAAVDLTTTSATPPFVVSPYGLSSSCKDNK
jgi:hypothetical protein